MRHFWPVFAVVVTAAALYVSREFLDVPDRILDRSARERLDASMSSGPLDPLHRAMRESKSRKVIVGVRDRNVSFAGLLVSVGNYCIAIEKSSESGGKATVVIPLESIAWVEVCEHGREHY